MRQRRDFILGSFCSLVATRGLRLAHSANAFRLSLRRGVTRKRLAAVPDVDLG